MNSIDGIGNTEELKKYYGNWETKDLLRAVAINKADYKPRAIEIINEELQRRGINDKTKAEFRKDWQETSFLSRGMPFCPKCHSFSVTDRSLWVPLFGPIIFGLLISRYRCLECGWTGSETYFDKR